MTLPLKPYPNGLFPAATDKGTGYSRVWIRDNIYTILGLNAQGEKRTVISALHGLLDIMLDHEEKIDWMIKQPHPKLRWRYIHPRYDKDGRELFEEWGNKQNDAIGALLWKIGTMSKEIRILRNNDDKCILQKLVNYLAAIEYWHDSDNGMWEENEEIHASSIGACVAGLNAVTDLVHVPLHLLAHGEETLKQLLPRESNTKEVDLALLSLIYPYRVVSKRMAKHILDNIEEHLVRTKGVIRYKGDHYYNKNGEAEWTMGFPWLAICHDMLGNTLQHAYYLLKTRESINDQGELPELYYSGSSEHNDNSPLLWSESLKIIAQQRATPL